MYEYILFDADDTLLDFEKDEHDAFFALLKENGLPFDEKLYDIYTSHNLSLWKMYERGEIDKKYIMDHRFGDLVSDGILSGNGSELNDRYCFHLSEGGAKMKNADSVCETLIEKGYKLCIVTNGIKFIQDKRFKKAELSKYFQHFFISECIGYQKPKKEYFDFVFDKLGEADRSKYLIVGDSLSSDISGGKNAGIDTCWFNVKNVRNDTETVPDYTIYELNELLKIL